MAKNITPFSIASPGFYGLNLSDSPVDLSPNFALVADNCVIDKSGRIACRKGYTLSHTTNADLGTNPVTCIGELIGNDGASTILATGGGCLFKLVGTTLTKLTYGGGGVAPTISADNWKFSQINGIAIFVQRGYDPLIYDPAVSATTFRRLNEKVGTAGTVYQVNECLSAYGRVWMADTSTDKQTVVWSDLLTPHVMTGGTAGSLDVRTVWPSGGDEIVALAAHNNFLIIFGKWQTLIYSGADDPATMKLYDGVLGIGCIARDSVQNTGTDVWFLSDSGVQSIQRTIQEKSAPVKQVSKNVLDDIQSIVSLEDMDNVKSCFSATNTFYLLTFPTYNKTYCFDTRAMLQDGSARVTTWSGIAPSAFYETHNRKVYFGVDGYVAEYSGYLDDTNEYRLQYYTTWIDFGNPIQTSILKKIILTLIGGTNQTIVFKWAYDFNQDYFSQATTITGLVTPAEYNVSEYNTTAEYVGNVFVNTLSVNGSSSGRVLQFGFEAQISGSPISVQKIDLFTKDGKL